MHRIIFAAALAVLPFAPALAQDYPPIQDHVMLNLTAEEWVETGTARVVVSVNAVVTGGNAATLRDEMLAAVGEIASGDGIEWRFTNFSRSLDSSGLERWYAQIEARLPEAKLGGIRTTAKDESRPGMQLTVDQIDFSPTLAEFEDVRAALRARIYELAAEERARLERELDRDWRVASIDFLGVMARPAPMPMRGRSMAMMESASADAINMTNAGGMAVSQKITMNAQVTLSVIAEGE